MNQIIREPTAEPNTDISVNSGPQWVMKHGGPNRHVRRALEKRRRPKSRNSKFVEPVLSEETLLPGQIVDGGLALTDRPAFIRAVSRALAVYDLVAVKTPGGDLMRVTARQAKMVSAAMQELP